MWSVPPPTVEAATKTHEATKIAYPAALPQAISDARKAYPDAIFHILPRASPRFPTLSDKHTGSFISDSTQTTDVYLLAALHQARLTKDATEVAEIKRANEISSRAHETVMRVLGQGVKGLIKHGKDAGITRPLLPNEWLIEKEAEAEALFVASCRREGSVLVPIHWYTSSNQMKLMRITVQCTRHTSQLLPHRLVRRLCTIAATTRSLHGAPSNHTTTRTMVTSIQRTKIKRSYHRCSSSTQGVNGTTTLPIVRDPSSTTFVFADVIPQLLELCQLEMVESLLLNLARFILWSLRCKR